MRRGENNGRRWTEAELRLLANRGTEVTAKLTGRTLVACQAKQSKLYAQDKTWWRRYATS